MRILQLGAHGDDEILGVGGTLAKYALNGHEVFSVIFVGKMNTELAKVIGSRYDDKVLEKRKRQSFVAAEILGIKESRYLNFEDETLRLAKMIHFKHIDTWYLQLASQEGEHKREPIFIFQK